MGVHYFLCSASDSGREWHPGMSGKFEEGAGKMACRIWTECKQPSRAQHGTRKRLTLQVNGTERRGQEERDLDDVWEAEGERGQSGIQAPNEMQAGVP